MSQPFSPWLDHARDPLVTGTFVAVSAILALVGVLFNAWLTNRTTTKTQARSLFVGTVTTERARWRQDLRDAVIDLTRLANLVVANTGTAEDAARLEGARVAIRLRLNPAGLDPRKADHHVFDRQVLDGLAAFAAAIKAGNGQEALSQLETIETGVQGLLKQEWDKSKTEARTGRLFGSRWRDRALKWLGRRSDELRAKTLQAAGACRRAVEDLPIGRPPREG